MELTEIKIKLRYDIIYNYYYLQIMPLKCKNINDSLTVGRAGRNRARRRLVKKFIELI